MENEKENKKPQTAVNKDYNPNKPEEITSPQYNSASEKRDSSNLPSIENLDHQNNDQKPQKQAKNTDRTPEKGINDESLFGKNSDTDLGSGSRDKDGDEDEKIIRT